MKNRLYRSRNNRVILGVCGGIAEYFNIDPVIIRIIAVLLIFPNGIGLLAYIIMAIIVPEEGSRAATSGDTIKENLEEIRKTTNELGEEIRTTLGESKPRPPGDRRYRGLYILGITIVVLGVLFLVGSLNFFWWLSWKYLWPLVLVAIGVLIILSSRRK